MTPGTGLLRLTRTAFFAVSAVGLASAAHLATRGHLPGSTALLAVPAVMLVINRLAAGRRGPIGLFLGMAATQAVLHLAFMVTSTAATCSPSVAMNDMAMTGHRHLAVECASSGYGGADSQFWPSVSMLLAHLLAALLLALVLARGEAAVWALASGLRFRFVLPGSVVQQPVVRQLPVTAAVVRRVPKPVHRQTLRRRGPPVLASAVR
ncbi:MAG TPA: hypothetical protein VLL08_03230 [Kineosporiaceae bacterium]|nr:hypothetical protein [Kineosporiaceae bacterium]